LQVSRFPFDPGPAAWNEILPPQSPRTALKNRVTAEWLIIGAGFTGLSAARRLSVLCPGSRVVVLDAKGVAEGPAGRNSGFMIDVPHDLTSGDYSGHDADANSDTIKNSQTEILLNRAGISYAQETANVYAMPEEAFDLSGKINGAITDKGVEHNKAYAQHLDQLSESYRLFDANEMEAITGTSCYQQGLFSPGTAMIQPALFIRSLALGVESRDISIYENSPVVDLTKSSAGWIADTAEGSVCAEKVILAVNGHLESFGFHQRSLMHIFTYGSMTEPLTTKQVKKLGGQSSWALTPAHALGTTVRRISGTGGDRLIIRNRATFDPSMTIDNKRLTSVAKVHDRSFIDRFPMLNDVRMQFRWGGRLCLSRNNVAVFGEVEKNLFAACCQNGLGTAKGMVSGKLIAESACGQISELSEYLVSQAEPVRLPSAAIAKLGVSAVLRWGEYRAGKEL